jgi:hypothetical protein
MNLDDSAFSNRPYWGADKVLGSARYLQICLDTLGLESWLLHSHPDTSVADIYEGRKYAIDLGFRLLIDSISDDYSFGLPEDFLLHRANWQGVAANEFQSDSVRAKIINNLLGRRYEIMTSSAPDEFEAAINRMRTELDSFLMNARKAAARPRGFHLAKITAIDYAAMWWVYLRAHDARFSEPVGFRSSLIDGDIGRDRTSRATPVGLGHIFQYFWTKMIGSIAANEAVGQIHLVKEWISADPERADRTFDDFFRPIQSQIIEPLEKLVGVGLNQGRLLPIRSSTLELFKPWLQDLPLQPLELWQRWRQSFAWYPIEVIGRSAQNLYTGAGGLLSALLGHRSMKQRGNNSEPVLIVRIRHPQGERRWDYSYAVLIEGGGSFGFSDYSGWLLFWDVAGNYSGTANNLRIQIENLITEFEIDRTVEVFAQIDVRQQTFLEWIDQEHSDGTNDTDKPEPPSTGISMDVYRELSSSAKNAQELLAESKGLLTELLGWWTETGELQPVNVEKSGWDNFGRGPVDLVIASNASGVIKFIECKASLDQFAEPKKMDELIAKVSKLTRDPNFKREWNYTSQTKIEIVVCFVKNLSRKNPLIEQEFLQRGITLVDMYDVVRKSNYSGVTKRLKKVYGLN